jgi:hypothetical protein
MLLFLKKIPTVHPERESRGDPAVAIGLLNISGKKRDPGHHAHLKLTLLLRSYLFSTDVLKGIGVSSLQEHTVN